MDYKKQLVNKILAILLFVVLILPSTIHFFHIFEGHDHSVNTEKRTNVHSSVSECKICDYQMASFNFDVAKSLEISAPKLEVKATINLDALLLHSFNITNTQLRAPPIFS